MKRIAVTLFNLGGPDRLESVQPFLFNLFNDKAIIDVPQPMRYFLAKLISWRRAKTAKEIYEHLGGGSPLLELTQQQAEALENLLNQRGKATIKTFIAMRYWHPMSPQTIEEVKAWQPDEIVLLPLYPHYSKTTTGSSFKDWYKNARQKNLQVQTHEIIDYHLNGGLIEAWVDLVRRGYEDAIGQGRPRILFSAHGLPKKVIREGDPYQRQVEENCAAVIEKLAIEGIDWAVCYQSRVGPLEWIGPSTEKELERAAKDGVIPVVVPIAFVSEHSETLVELDIEYRELAEELGIKGYVRVPTVLTHPAFIAALADLVEAKI